MLRPDVSHSAVDRSVWTVARSCFISDGWRYTTVGLLFIIQETRFIVQLSRKIEETKLTRLSRDKLSYTLRSVFVVFIVCTFRFSPISKEISSSSRQLSLISKNSFSPKTTKFGKHSLFSSVGKFAFSATFTAYVRLMVEVTLVKNWSSWSDWSGKRIPWDICTRFGCYLYSAD